MKTTSNRSISYKKKSIGFQFEKLINFVKSFFSKGHERSLKAKKHIVFSFLIKGLSVVIGFVAVPVTLGYISQEQYGIWLTLSSIVAWLSFFDIGLGKGLRNKLAESLAKGDIKKAKIYVSSTYGFLSALFLSVLILLLIANQFIEWHLILNIPSERVPEINLIVSITICFFCINIVLKLLHTIFFADQKPSIPGFLNLITNALSLSIILLLTKFTDGSLLYLALTLGSTPIIILMISSIIVYNSKYRQIAPSVKLIERKHFHDLIGLGFRFFVVGISSLVIFSTDNFIISQLFGPAAVPSYAISHKYFSLVTIVFGIIGVPFWSAYTEAFLKKDMKWIVGTNKTLVKIWLSLSIFSVFMLLFSEVFYQLWVPEIEISFQLSVFMCIYVNTLAFGNIYVWFINGVGKVKLQTLIAIAAAVLNIPLSYFFAEYCNLGTSGVILASLICIGYGPILAPMQFKKIINGTASGIWNK